MPEFALDQNVAALAVAFGADVGAIDDAIVAVNARVDNIVATGGEVTQAELDAVAGRVTVLEADIPTAANTDYVALYEAAK